MCLVGEANDDVVTVLLPGHSAAQLVTAISVGWLMRAGPPGALLAATAALLFLRRAPTRLRKVKGHGRSSANAAADGLAALGRARAARGAPPGAVPGLTAGPLSAAVRAQWARFLPS